MKQAWIDSDASGSKNSQMMLQNQHELLSHSEGINVLTIHGRVFDKNEEEDPIRRALTQSLSACQLSKYPNEG